MGARLLVIEDDDAVAALFSEVLGCKGYVVQCVGSPEEARRLLLEAGPDAVHVVLSNPFGEPDAPYAWLDQLRTLTGAPIVICSMSCQACVIRGPSFK